MKLQELVVIFVIIIFPITLLLSFYISTGTKTLTYQSLYDHGLITATHDAIYAFELNTTNDAYSDNAETKRNILKASVKQFEKSLANTCGISAYHVDDIEEYIPAILFGMYDGFYLYAPSYNVQTGKYEHNLKNYVYYSETLTLKNGSQMNIIYSLDNFVVVSGIFDKKTGYETRSGYLLYPNDTQEDGKKYKGTPIGKETINGSDNDDAIQYYKEAYRFSTWFLDKVKIDNADYLTISNTNDPENEKSAFVQHKRRVMQEKIQNVLNSTITAYATRMGNYNYKMPSLSKEDWQKVYQDISVISFFQGKKIGLTNYNGYCVLNSTNHSEFPNPSLLYFINTNNNYHDIRCSHITASGSMANRVKLTGFRIGRYQKKKIKISEENIEEGTSAQFSYQYENDLITNAYACYYCINGQITNNKPIYNFIQEDANSQTKRAYYTAIARERYNTVKVTPTSEKDEKMTLTVNVTWEGERTKYKLILYKNTSTEIRSVVENSKDVVKFENLPKYDEDGNTIPYSVKIELLENANNYETPEIHAYGTWISITAREKDLTPIETMDKRIEVRWKDAKEHKNIQFTLELYCVEDGIYTNNYAGAATITMGSTMPVEGYTVEGTNSCNVEFTELPRTTSDGEMITYYFKINGQKLNGPWQAIDNLYQVQYNDEENTIDIRFR